MPQERVNEDHERRVAVVTGGNGYLGRAICAEYLRHDYAVVCVSRGGGEGLHEALGATHEDVLCVAADLTVPTAVEEAFDAIGQWRGRIDSLVNNAAPTATPRTPFWTIDDELWEDVVLNTTTITLHSTRAALPLLRVRGGRVVNLSSNTAAFGMANYLQYVTAKTSIVGMTKGMARELGEFGISVNAVAPGLVKTERTSRTMTEEYWDSVLAGQAIHRALDPQDIANAVYFLGSDLAAMITGQTLLVNGGANMGAF